MGEIRQEARQAFGNALREALGEGRQRWLGDQLGGMHQSSVSNWMAGKNEPDPWVVFEIEVHLGLFPGELSRHLGYVPVGVSSIPSVVAAVRADSTLDEMSRRALINLYRTFRGSSPPSSST